MSIIKLISIFRDKIYYFRERRRIKILQSHGMDVGKNVTIMPGVDFDYPYSKFIFIGDNCSLSKDVRIMVHDATTYKYLGYTIVKAVKIYKNSFIGERAIILPGVEIGPNAIVAAGSVVNRNIPSKKVAAGNPARIYNDMPTFLEKSAGIIREGIVLEHNEFFSPQRGPVSPPKNGQALIIKKAKIRSYIYGGSPEQIQDEYFEKVRESIKEDL